MREIKFRFWDDVIKHMYYGEEVDENNNESRSNWYCITKECGLIVGNVGPSGMDSYDLIIMQYTGLKDKNGKEIYEGDIVKVMGMTLAVVKYSENRGAYYLECRDDIGDVGLICQYDTIEVIGNIYENKELLEVK